MRHIQVIVPRGRGSEALEIATRHEVTNAVRGDAHDIDGPVEIITADVENDRVEKLLDDLQRLPELRITFAPRAVLALQPPAEEAHAQVTDVTHLSPVEIFLAGVQSVGSWRTFLGYAAAAGAVVWIGLFTDTIYLLTAAMLIAPFAGPAMNAALATARGDGKLLLRSMARYGASLTVAAAVAALLTLIMQQRAATELMLAASTISSVAVVLPIVAGAAGALHLGQSERSSLVSGAATGILVAASLAPAAGLVGMASVLGEWAMVRSGAFLLLLQIAGINLSGAIVFRLYGVSPAAPRYERGRSSVAIVGYAVAAVGVGALLTWQFTSEPALQRSTRAARAAEVIHDLVDASRLGTVVETNVRFSSADARTLLAEVYVQRGPGAKEENEAVARTLTHTIQERLVADFAVTPLVDVTVMAPPSAPSLGAAAIPAADRSASAGR